jgi:hypothetical protein
LWRPPTNLITKRERCRLQVHGVQPSIAASAFCKISETLADSGVDPGAPMI